MLTNFAYTESDACGSDVLLGEVTRRVLQEETCVVTKEVTLRSDRHGSHVMIKIMNRNEKEKLKVMRRKKKKKKKMKTLSFLFKHFQNRTFNAKNQN